MHRYTAEQIEQKFDTKPAPHAVVNHTTRGTGTILFEFREETPRVPHESSVVDEKDVEDLEEEFKWNVNEADIVHNEAILAFSTMMLSLQQCSQQLIQALQCIEELALFL